MKVAEYSFRVKLTRQTIKRSQKHTLNHAKIEYFDIFIKVFSVSKSFFKEKKEKTSI